MTEHERYIIANISNTIRIASDILNHKFTNSQKAMNKLDNSALGIGEDNSDFDDWYNNDLLPRYSVSCDFDSGTWKQTIGVKDEDITMSTVIGIAKQIIDYL